MPRADHEPRDGRSVVAARGLAPASQPQAGQPPSSASVGGFAPARVHAMAAARTAEPGRPQRGPGVERGAGDAVVDEARERGSAERVPRADRVDDLDPRHLDLVRHAVGDDAHRSPPSVTRIARGPSAASHASAASRSSPGRRYARSSTLTLTTSARARSRRHAGPVRRRVADDRRPAVRVDEQEHVVRERGDERRQRRGDRLQDEAERPGVHGARPRRQPARRAAPAGPRARTSRPCRSGTSRRPPRPAPRGRASSAGRCAGRGRGRRRRR